MPPPSPCIEVRPQSSKHRALHATTSFLPGQIILTFSPLLLLPSLSRFGSVCSHCLKPGTPRACTRCRAAYYCDQTCQAAGWKASHARECKVLERLGADRAAQLPTPVRALMQALLDPTVEAGLSELDGHVDARRGGEGWADLEMMASGACSFTGRGSSEEQLKKALEFLCKMQTNAFHRYDADLGQVGIFLEPTLAMANHSCIPNAFVQFIGRDAILRAESKIDAGQEIEISYTDYTYPLHKRRKALALYQFECQCVRCRNDLNIYQVCAKSPNTELNRLSLATDVTNLRNHPATHESEKQSVARSVSNDAAVFAHSTITPESLDDRRRVLKNHYRLCEPLISHNLWAISPLPQTMGEMSIYYAEMGDFASALAVACHIATCCDPYRYTAVFHPVRVKNLFMIAKLLSNTAAETSSLNEAVKSRASISNVKQQILETLQNIDQVALCEMLLIMVIRLAPEGRHGDSEIAVSAREILDEIQQLPGREKELSLIRSWSTDPANEKSRVFFEYAVVQQVNGLAQLGCKVLQVDFGTGSP